MERESGGSRIMVMDEFSKNLMYSFIKSIKILLRTYCRHEDTCSECVFRDGCNGGDMIKTVNFFCDKILEGIY